jgi:hypothetical protein
MREIPLTQSKVALVDDEDFNYLNQWNWCINKDVRTLYAFKGKSQNSNKASSMHQLLVSVPEGMEIDHINHNGLDNRKENLRVCTHAENIHNQRTQNRNKTSQFKGVCWMEKSKRWRARIKVNMEFIYLGSFISEIKAALAYDKASKKYYGDFSCTNFIDV